MSDSSSGGSWAEIFTPRYATVTLILCLGVALFAFNAFLASVALPTAVQQLGGIALISWALTLYLVFAIMGGAGAALLKQRLGSRTALLVSAGLFIAGTLIAATASSMAEVLVGRAVQGLGEGIMAAICFALIPELFPSRLVPKVFGMQAVVWAVAAFGGPVGAGLLTELVSWRAAFLVNVPLVAIFVAGVLFVVPGKNRDAAPVAVGFPGIRLLAIGAGIMLVALAGITPPLEAAALLVGAAVLLVGAVLLDRRSRIRLMPLGAYWPGSVVGSGLIVALLMPVAQAGAAVYLILLMQQLWGYGPTVAGGIGAVMAVAWSASAITVANVQRGTRKYLMRSGPALVTLGLAGLLAGLLSEQLAIVIVAQLAIGAGFGISNGYLNLSMMEAASDEERDRTSALLPTTQSAGNAIGAALAGVAANSAGYASATTADQIHQAIVPVFILGAVIAGCAFLASLRMTGLMARSTNTSAFAAAE
ncbi:MFS transporter [Youhaiella tibetensis]|uniref:MFS transporter n=1 Tax=Paradevosia tibetensis TaxID=1447062 RepID=A0A5B9DI11_9HYPH|nr:MFS transporter [Youhaiella tibetensis]AKR57727.1 MFS transporter [Devosia sp. H5989]QEE18676.1 MFS transporter [Youhaiella tibetensis]GGF40174.1 MFS transporter [Youhaiella tibetensis]